MQRFVLSALDALKLSHNSMLLPAMCVLLCKQHFVSVPVDKKAQLKTEMEKVQTDLRQKVCWSDTTFALPEEAHSSNSLKSPTIPCALKRPSGASHSKVSEEILN